MKLWKSVSISHDETFTPPLRLKKNTNNQANKETSVCVVCMESQLFFYKVRLKTDQLKRKSGCENNRIREHSGPYGPFTVTSLRLREFHILVQNSELETRPTNWPRESTLLCSAGAPRLTRLVSCVTQTLISPLLVPQCTCIAAASQGRHLSRDSRVITLCHRWSPGGTHLFVVVTCVCCLGCCIFSVDVLKDNTIFLIFF